MKSHQCKCAKQRSAPMKYSKEPGAFASSQQHVFNSQGNVKGFARLKVTILWYYSMYICSPAHLSYWLLVVNEENTVKPVADTSDRCEVRGKKFCVGCNMDMWPLQVSGQQPLYTYLWGLSNCQSCTQSFESVSSPRSQQRELFRLHLEIHTF